MATSYIIIDYMLNEMVADLMNSRHIEYQQALEMVLATETYKKLLEDEDLQQEGPLYIIELMNKELANKMA